MRKLGHFLDPFNNAIFADPLNQAISKSSGLVVAWDQEWDMSLTGALVMQSAPYATNVSHVVSNVGGPNLTRTTDQCGTVATINGKNALRFNTVAAENTKAYNCDYTVIPQPLMVECVFEWDGTGPAVGGRVVWDGYVAQPNLCQLYILHPSNDMNIYAGTPRSIAFDLPTGPCHLLAEYNGASTVVYVNGVAKTPAASPGALGMRGLTIFNDRDTNANNFGTGAKMGLWRAKGNLLSADDRTTLIAQTMTEWGMTPP